MMLGWWRGRSRSDQRRWVVVDVETTGMNLASDELLSVGCVAIVDGHVIPADSFEITIGRPAASTRDNILVHGIGAQAQLGGTEPSAALRAFLDYVDAAPLIAFHAHFDRTFLERSLRSCVERRLQNEWLDLAELAPALDPTARLKSLDEWLLRYRIAVSARHSAASDAFATALLAARLLRLAMRQGARSFSSMQRLAKSTRWLQQ